MSQATPRPAVKRTVPAVSVLLAVRNGGPYLRAAVESLLCQTYDNFELIVIDDGSSDGSAEVVESYNDHRIRVFRQEPRGLANSLNRAAAVSRGALLVRHDADDRSHPRRLERQAALFESCPSLVLVSCAVGLMSREGEVIGMRPAASDRTAALSSLKKFRNPFVHGTLAIRRDAFFHVGGYNERYSTSQDFDLIARLAAIGEFAAVEEIGYFLRLHPDSVTAAKWHQQISAKLAAVNVVKPLARRATYPNLMRYLLAGGMRLAAFRWFNREAVYHYRVGCLHLQNRNVPAAVAAFDSAARRSRMFLPARVRRVLALRSRVVS